MGLALFNFVFTTLVQKANSNTPGNSLFLPVALSNLKNPSDDQPYLPLSQKDWSSSNLSGLQTAQLALIDGCTSNWSIYFAKLSACKPGTQEPIDGPTQPTVQITSQQISDAGTALKAYSATGGPRSVDGYPNQGPSIYANDVLIQGLANLLISSQPTQATPNGQGYAAQVTLTPNSYAQASGTWAEPLALAGSVQGVNTAGLGGSGTGGQSFLGLNFQIAQPAQFVDESGNPCPPPTGLDLPASIVVSDANAFDVSATCIGSLNLTNAQIDAVGDVTVSSGNGASALAVNITSLTLAPQTGDYPTFALADLDWVEIAPTPFSPAVYYGGLYSTWASFVTSLVNISGPQVFTQQINVTLQDQHNLNQISTFINGQLATTFDTIFGSSQLASLSGGAVANPVDGYLFGRACGALNDPNSYLYIPALVAGAKNPTLDPYAVGTISLAGPYSTPVENSTITIKNLSVSSLTITGLSNMTLPPANVTLNPAQAQVTATLALATLSGSELNVKNVANPIAPNITATGSLSLSVQVNQYSPVALSDLTLTMTMQNTSGDLGLTVTLTATGDSPSDLVLSFSDVQLVTGSGDVTMALSSTDSNSEEYLQFINPFLSQQNIITGLVGQINSYIGTDLAQIGKGATAFVQNALNNLGSSSLLGA